MAIKWFNIRSKEVVVAESEPQISALWASSDHSPNITQGQDFGWRLAPEVVVKMKKIKQDYRTLADIAQEIGKNVDEVTEPDILTYISNTDAQAQDAMAQEGDYTDEYEQAIRDEEIKQANQGAPASTNDGVESLADLQKRVELEERLAAARAANSTETTTVVPTTTTTTTKAPTTTTTTTKKA